MIKFNKHYFSLAIVLLITEVLIAIYLHDDFIRPYVGDYLVVMLIYCTVKSLVSSEPVKTAIGVLIFSYFVEALQYLNFVKVIGLQDSRIANVVLGNYFTWVDILAYTLGVVTIIIVERLRE